MPLPRVIQSCLSRRTLLRGQDWKQGDGDVSPMFMVRFLGTCFTPIAALPGTLSSCQGFNLGTTFVEPQLWLCFCLLSAMDLVHAASANTSTGKFTVEKRVWTELKHGYLLVVLQQQLRAPLTRLSHALVSHCNRLTVPQKKDFSSAWARHFIVIHASINSLSSCC